MNSNLASIQLLIGVFVCLRCNLGNKTNQLAKVYKIEKPLVAEAEKGVLQILAILAESIHSMIFAEDSRRNFVHRNGDKRR